MTVELENAENLIKQKYLEYRADHIPCTVRSTYTNLDGKKDIPVSTELKLIDSNRTIIGIEYDANGKPAEVYTTDAKGKKIKLKTDEPKRSSKLPDLIGKRLTEATKAISKEMPKTTPAPEKTKKIVRKTTIPYNSQELNI